MIFSPRLNKAGIETSQYWNSLLNPFYPTYGLPNCTCYAWGRSWEATGIHPTLPTSNGDSWWDDVTGYNKGQIAKLGAVACFSKSGTTGHVGFVEQINGEDIILSNSNYYRDTTSGIEYENNLFYLKSVATIINEGYTLQGYIYNTYDDIIITSGKRKKYPFILYNKKNRRRNIL